MSKTKKLVAVLASFAMVTYLAAPVLGSTDLVITGNGSGSQNFTQVNQTSTTNVTQNNTANVTNNVSADSNSGSNNASFNTGGMVTVASGPATTNVDVTNVLNNNIAEVDCCATNAANVEISDNGDGSKNQAYLDLENSVNVDQDNLANVTNNVDADAISGWNSALGNTGDGFVTVVAGAATTDVDVTTIANTNSAHIGPAQPGGSMVTALILDNGAGTVNWIDLDVAKSVRLDQDNLANVTNNVDALAKSGFNRADYNTGTEVLVGSGAATANADVLNSVNFNHADVDCGCVTDLYAKIAGNGGGNYYPYPTPGNEWAYDTLSVLPYWYFPASTNTILADLVSRQVVGQDNLANLTNNADVDALSGWNKATANTGDTNGDPAVVSGPATTNTNVVNDGNVNILGDLPWTWPTDWPWAGSDVEVSMNFSALWMAWSGLWS